MGEASSSAVPCGGCTLCCRHQKVFLLAGDDASLRTVLDRRPDGAIGDRLAVKPDGSCYYLGEGGCTIYDRRPRLCRIFDCREHMDLPRPERRRREKMMDPHNLRIVARGRELKESA